MTYTLCKRSLILFPMMLSLLAFGCSENNMPPANGPVQFLVLALSSPARLADYDTDTFLITDYQSRAVHFADKASLEIRRSIRVGGQPTGIAHSGGFLYVGNKTTGSVEVYSSAGEFQFYLGGTEGLFENVLDIAIDEIGGLVYVLDAKAARVDVFDLNGNAVQTDFTAGNGPDNLVGPSAIATGPNSRLYVSDYGAAGDFNDQTIKIFNSGGAIIGKIKSGGSSFSAPAFYAPQGLHVDATGNIFMADSGSSVVFVYNASITFEKKIGARGTQDGEIFYPLDVLIDDASKDLLIADNRNGRITVLAGQGGMP